MRFVLKEDPIPKARPRYFLAQGKINLYDPRKQDKERVQEKLLLMLKQAISSENIRIAQEAAKLVQCDVFHVRLIFCLPMPKNWTDGRKNAVLWGLEECSCKPDIDNLEKFYLDCFSGIFFSDDRQVCSMTSKKKFSQKGEIVIEIMGKKKTSLPDEAEGILQIFGPDRLFQLLRQVWELFELYDVDEADDWVVEKIGDRDARGVRLARTAYVLSVLASHHGKYFDKIQKKYPDFWREAEKIAQEMVSPNEIKQND